MLSDRNVGGPNLRRALGHPPMMQTHQGIVEEIVVSRDMGYMSQHEIIHNFLMLACEVANESCESETQRQPKKYSRRSNKSKQTRLRL